MEAKEVAKSWLIKIPVVLLYFCVVKKEEREQVQQYHDSCVLSTSAVTETHAQTRRMPYSLFTVQDGNTL